MFEEHVWAVAQNKYSRKQEHFLHKLEVQRLILSLKQGHSYQWGRQDWTDSVRLSLRLRFKVRGGVSNILSTLFTDMREFLQSSPFNVCRNKSFVKRQNSCQSGCTGSSYSGYVYLKQVKWPLRVNQYTLQQQQQQKKKQIKQIDRLLVPTDRFKRSFSLCEYLEDVN